MFEIIIIDPDFFYGSCFLILIVFSGFLFHVLEWFGYKTGIIREEYVTQRNLYSVDINKLLKEGKNK